MRRILALGLLSLVLASCSAPRRAHLAAENALGPYSGSVQAQGFVFVSGKGGARTGSFAEEAEGALRAVEKELGRSGLGLGDVVSCTVFLTDMAQYAEFNQVYAKLVPAPWPARACVAVSALPANLRVEVQAVVARR